MDLWTAVRRGREWSPSKELGAISALKIRDLILTVSNGVQAAPAGILIRRATIEGMLDLSRSMPGLVGSFGIVQFDHCLFTDEIRIDRGRFRRFALPGCKFRRLRARDTVFESGLDLRRITTPPRDLTPAQLPDPFEVDECSVELVNATIEGDILLGYAQLRVGPLRDRMVRLVGSDEPKEVPPPYALSLRGTRVEGAVRLEPDFSAIGGVTISDSRITGDFRAHGAKLKAKHGAALRAQTATVEGVVYCRSEYRNGASASFEAEGGLVFNTATLGRLELQGAIISADAGAPAEGLAQDPEPWAVDLTSATLRSGLAADDQSRFDGAISLRGATVTGDVVFTGAHISTLKDHRPFKNRTDYALAMTNAKVHGSVHLQSGFCAEGGVTIADSEINGDLFTFGADLRASDRGAQALGGNKERTFALRGRNARIGGVLRAGAGEVVYAEFQRMRCVGGVSFPNATMDKADFGGASIEGGLVGLDFEGACIRGPLLFNSVTKRPHDQPDERVTAWFEGEINLTDAIVDGDITFQFEQLEIPSSTSRLAALLRAEGLKSGGSLTLDLPDIVEIVSLNEVESPSKSKTSTIHLNTARIGRNLTLRHRSPVVFYAQNIHVDGDLSIVGPRFTLGRPRHDEDLVQTQDAHPKITMVTVEAVIGRSLILRGLRFCEAREGTGVIDTLAKGMTIGAAFMIEDCQIASLVEFDRAKVGGSMFMRRISFKARTPDESEPTRARLRIDALYLDSLSVASGLRVRWVGAGAMRSGRLPVLDSVPYRVEDTPPLPHISLVFASVRHLDDWAGEGWRLNLQLALRGFTYEALVYDARSAAAARLAAVAANGPAKATPWPERRDQISAARKRRWRWALGISAAIVGVLVVALVAYLSGIGWIEGSQYALRPYGFVILCIVGALVLTSLLPPLPGLGPPPRFRERHSWLRQQFSPRKLRNAKVEYFSQPYLQASRVFRAQGQFAEADAMLIERMWQEVRVLSESLTGPPREISFRALDAVIRRKASAAECARTRSLRLRPLQRQATDVTWFLKRTRYLFGLWVARPVVWTFAWLYFATLGFGLKPLRTLTTVAAYWLIGCALVMGAMHEGAIGQAEPSPDGPTRPVCSRHVFAALYVTTMLIPLRDEAGWACRLAADDQPGPSPSAPSGLWPMLFTLYGLVGLIGAPFAILTVSGVIRRFVERGPGST
jgi:hypothetical protein